MTNTRVGHICERCTPELFTLKLLQETNYICTNCSVKWGMARNEK